MRKKVATLMFVVLICFPIFGTQVFAAQSVVVKNNTLSEELVKPTYAPITRLWYETLSMPYQGPKKWVRVNQWGNCLEGYTYPRNVGANHYIYEGYLYPCGGPIPLPASIEEENE